MPDARLTIAPPAVPDHEMLRCIGRGSYGEVWLARNVMAVYRAVKVVYRDRFESERPFEREFNGIQRFEPISRTHESQVDILHVGRQNGYFYYVMELADDAGDPDPAASERSINPETYAPKTLFTLLKRGGRLPFDLCLDLALNLTTALHHLHQHGLVHRDVKPSNIIFLNGIPKLADIGLVTDVEGTFSFVGTEGYLPPEGPGKPAADLYSFGKVLYEMSTGRDRMDYPELPTHLRDETDRDGYAELNEITLKACEEDVSRRYQDAEQMHQDLLLIRAGRSLRRVRAVERHLARVTRLGIAFLVVALLFMGAYFYQQRQTREAQRLRNVAEAAVSRQELQKIDQMLETGRSSHGLAQLAHRVRVNPNDTSAARRLLSALTYRDFALPLMELRHEDVIMDGAISPDGQRLVTGTSKGDVVFWDLAGGNETARRKAGEFSAYRYTPGSYIIPSMNVDIDPSGTRVVAPGGRSCVAKIWNLAGEQSLSLEITDSDTAGSSPAEYWHAEFSPDGKRVAVMALSGAAGVWDAETGAKLASMVPEETGGGYGIYVICRFTSDGSKLITAFGRLGGRHKALFVWDSMTGELLRRRNEPAFSAGNRLWRANIALDPSGPRLAFTREWIPAFLRMWDYESDEMISASPPHEWPMNCVAFSPDGRWVASGSNDQTFRVWEAGETLRLRHVLRQPGFVTTVAFSPNGELAASGSERGIIQLWNPVSGEPVGEPNEHGGSVRHVEFTPDGERLISYDDHSAWVWDIRPGAARPTLLTADSHGDQPGFITSVQYSPDGGYLLASSGSYAGIGRYGDNVRPVLSRPLVARVWNPRSGQPASPDIPGGGAAVVFAPEEGRWRVFGVEFAAYWDPQTGIEKRQPIDVLGRMFVVSPDGRRVLTSDRDFTAVWDTEQGRELPRLRQEAPCVAGAFSPDSTRVFLALIGEAGRILQLDSGETVTSMDGPAVPGGWGHALWSPDGRLICLGQHSTARLYDAVTGEATTDWLRHDDTLSDIKFSGDGRYLVTSSSDQTAKVWDVSSGRQITPNLAHDWVIYAASLTRDGREVGTASWDKTARVWAREGGLPLTEPLPHPDWVLDVDFHPSGRWLATGCKDGAARVWELPQPAGSVPEWLLDLAEALAGYHVTEADNLERLGGRKQLLASRQHLKRELAEEDDDYVRWGRWFFADRARRVVSPTAEMDMDTYQRRLAKMDSIKLLSVHETLLRIAPMNARYLARLGHKLVTYEDSNWLPDLERAEWLTRLAVMKDPESPTTWSARAEVLRTADDHQQATAAVERALGLNAGSPGAWFVKALLLHDGNQHAEAYDAFKRAVQQLLHETESSPDDVDPLLEPLLRIIATIDLSDAAMLERMTNQVRGRSERFRVVTEWLTAMAAEQASGE